MIVVPTPALHVYEFEKYVPVPIKVSSTFVIFINFSINSLPFVSVLMAYQQVEVI